MASFVYLLHNRGQGKLNENIMYTEKQLISFSKYCADNPSKHLDITDSQVSNWKMENNLPLVDEGHDLYNHPCIVDFGEHGTLKGIIKKHHNANNNFSYDVQVNLEFHSERMYNLSDRIVKLVYPEGK